MLRQAPTSGILGDREPLCFRGLLQASSSGILGDRSHFLGAFLILCWIFWWLAHAKYCAVRFYFVATSSDHFWYLPSLGVPLSFIRTPWPDQTELDGIFVLVACRVETKKPLARKTQRLENCLEVLLKSIQLVSLVNELIHSWDSSAWSQKTYCLYIIYTLINLSPWLDPPYDWWLPAPERFLEFLLLWLNNFVSGG